MKEACLKKLMNRVRNDKVISLILAMVFAIIACYHLVQAIVAVNGDETKNIVLQSQVSQFVNLSCMAAVLLLLGLVLHDIGKNEKTFGSGNVKKVRWMAIIFIASYPVQVVLLLILEMLNASFTSFSMQIQIHDLMFMIFGVIIGIISEIFFYGKEMEEEIDTIA